MSWISWGLSSSNPQYEELVEKACSPLKLPGESEDIALNLEICDLIRSKAVQPKPAMQALKKRVASKNGRVQMSALARWMHTYQLFASYCVMTTNCCATIVALARTGSYPVLYHADTIKLIDTCIKNGGDHFLLEIASKEFIDEMTSLIKATGIQPDVHNLALKLFQQWALAFESKPELSYFVDVYKELKLSGIKFPPPPPALPSHLLTTSTAPTWIDSDTCMRCRTAFTFTNRKHHCRNCGQVFDQACSSKSIPIPRFGITQPVRVCEGCYLKSGAANAVPGPALPAQRTPRSRMEMDKDLQRAIELSLAEAQPGGAGGFVGSEPPLVARSGAQVEDDDEEFRLAIEASLRESERARPSAPNGLEEHDFKPLPTFDLHPRETETILTFSSVIDQAAAYGERDLRRFPHAHDLYAQAYQVGAKLQRNVEEKQTKQQMLGEMQSKINEAVGLYGVLLDRQRDYAESRARYAQQQSSLQQGYAVSNQHAYPDYAPQQQHPAAPSLYPSLQQVQYPAQPYAQAQYPQHQAYAGDYQPQRQTSRSFATSPALAPASAPTHEQYQQQTSQSYAPHEQLQRHHSQSYAPSTPYQESPQPHFQQQAYPSQPQAIPQQQYSSDTQGYYPSSSSVPQRQQSYNEPTPSAPPRSQSYQSPQPAAPVPLSYPESVQPYAYAHTGSPERQAAFPAFPAAPQDAFAEPQPEPQREEPKEALLIEL